MYAMVPMAEPGLVTKTLLSLVGAVAVLPPPTASATRREAPCFARPKSKISLGRAR